MECGIDFGTTYSTVCFNSVGVKGLVPVAGSVFVPTCIFITYNRREFYIGRRATFESGKRTDGELFINLKRWIGCYEGNLEEYTDKIRPEYSVRAHGKFGTSISGIKPNSTFVLPVIDLITLFLKGLIIETERYTSQNATGFVCSVPADYNTFKRNFLAVALSYVGKPLRALINEPTAAALCNLVLKSVTFPVIGVFDFGGGTFDVSFLRRQADVFAVLYSTGDNHLGGRDVDRAIAEFLMKTFHINSVSGDFSIIVQNIKESLSSDSTKTKHLVVIGEKEMKLTLTSEELVAISKKFLNRAIALFKRGLEFLSFPNIVVVLTGGSSALPGLVDMLKEVKGVVDVLFDIDIYRVSVAIGAKLYCDLLSQSGRYVLLDSCTHTLSDETVGFVPKVMFEKGCAIPCTRETQYEIAGSTMRYGLFEGERNKTWLNEMTFAATDRRPSKVSKFDKVVFKLSVDGRLSVTVDGRVLVNEMVPPPATPDIFRMIYKDGSEDDLEAFSTDYVMVLNQLYNKEITQLQLLNNHESFSSMGINDAFKLRQLEKL